MYIYTYIYVYIYTHIYVFMYKYMHTHAHTHTHPLFQFSPLFSLCTPPNSPTILPAPANLLVTRYRLSKLRTDICIYIYISSAHIYIHYVYLDIYIYTFSNQSARRAESWLSRVACRVLVVACWLSRDTAILSCVLPTDICTYTDTFIYIMYMYISIYNFFQIPPFQAAYSKQTSVHTHIHAYT